MHKNPWFWLSVVLVLILGGSLFAVGSGGESTSQGPSAPSPVTSSQARPKLQPLSGVDVSPQPFEFGQVSMKKGVVTQPFSLKNKTGKDLAVAKIETSCMCTEASLKVGDKESPYFGMPGHTSNPGWPVTISKDGEASVTVKFDPNAHGPEGTGLAKRVIRIFFSDPQNTYLDINFSVDVVK